MSGFTMNRKLNFRIVVLLFLANILSCFATTTTTTTTLAAPATGTPETTRTTTKRTPGPASTTTTTTPSTTTTPTTTTTSAPTTTTTKIATTTSAPTTTTATIATTTLSPTTTTTTSAPIATKIRATATMPPTTTTSAPTTTTTTVATTTSAPTNTTTTLTSTPVPTTTTTSIIITTTACTTTTTIAAALAIIPAIPSILACKLCFDWHKKEMKNLKWLKEVNKLMKCPCRARLANGKEMIPSDNPSPDITWRPDPSCKNPKSKGCKKFHPGAAGCIRSVEHTARNAAQQCCYDINGKLLKAGTRGAGTPDKEYPGFCNGVFIAHFWADVVPYYNCCVYCKLDDHCLKYVNEARKGDDSHCER